MSTFTHYAVEGKTHYRFESEGKRDRFINQYRDARFALAGYYDDGKRWKESPFTGNLGVVQQRPALPLDPDRLNDKRAEAAEHAIKAFQERTGAEDGDALVDLLYSLRHLCDREPERYGDFDQKLTSAGYYYEDQTAPL